MFFGKKNKGEIPSDEMEKMIRKGMDDKEMIKQLKSKGYSYEAIEKAMLRAVKQGVSEQPARRYGNVQEESDYSLPTADSFVPESVGAEGFDMLGEQPVFEQPQEEDYSIEELIEGIVEDKWHKFEDSVKRMEDRIERLRAELQQTEGKIKETRTDTPQREVDVRLNEFNDKLDDLDARVGGLEKAFKQFLPALTRNIESLSAMIHEMKAKNLVGEAEKY